MEWIQIDKNVTQAIVYADDIENRNYIAKHKGFGEHNSQNKKLRKYQKCAVYPQKKIILLIFDGYNSEHKKNYIRERIQNKI